MAVNIPAALRQLATTLEKLKELAEWDKLEKQEFRLEIPPSFQPSDHLAEEIRSQYSLFIATVLELQEILNKLAMDVPPGQLAKWRRRLRELESQVNQLELGERFIRL